MNMFACVVGNALWRECGALVPRYLFTAFFPGGATRSPFRCAAASSLWFFPIDVVEVVPLEAVRELGEECGG